MKILAFGASNSRNSINKSFANFVANQFEGADKEIIDLNEYTLPIYSIDLENASGFPPAIQDFVSKLDSADLIIISLAEHNGSYTAAFKNLFDWTSRFKNNMFEGKSLFLLSASPGARGAASVMQAAQNRFPIHGAEIIGSFSLPKYPENFKPEQGIINEKLKENFSNVLETVKQKLQGFDTNRE